MKLYAQQHTVFYQAIKTELPDPRKQLHWQCNRGDADLLFLSCIGACTDTLSQQALALLTLLFILWPIPGTRMPFFFMSSTNSSGSSPAAQYSAHEEGERGEITVRRWGRARARARARAAAMQGQRQGDKWDIMVKGRERGRWM